MIRLALTGTDSGVGKTLVGTALLAMLRARGMRVSAMKPFDTSQDDDESGSDADVLRAAAGCGDALELVRPMAIAEPDAPLVTSRQSKVPLDLMKVDDAFASLCEGRDAIVVESAGGLLGPITGELSFDDLFAAWELDVVIIAPSRMGAINAVRLTERAARTAGLRVRGVVLNTITRDSAGIAGPTNRDALADLLPGVPIVTFPWVRSAHDLEQLGRVAERHGLSALLPELSARDAVAFATPLSSRANPAPPATKVVSSIDSSGATMQSAPVHSALPVPSVSKSVAPPGAPLTPAGRLANPGDAIADTGAVGGAPTKPEAQHDTKADAGTGRHPEAKAGVRAEMRAEPGAGARAGMRAEPKAAPKETRTAAPKAVAPRAVVPKVVTPKAETPKADVPKAEMKPERERPDAIDDAFAAVPLLPPAPVTPSRSDADTSRTGRMTPGGTVKYFDEDDPRLPDEGRGSGARADRLAKFAGDARAAPRPPARSAGDSPGDFAAAATPVTSSPPRQAEPRQAEPRQAQTVGSRPDAVSEDEAAAAMDRLLAIRASRATPPEPEPTVPAVPAVARSDSSSSPSRATTPSATSTSGSRASSQPSHASSAPTPPSPRRDAPSAPAGKPEARPSKHATPSGGVFRAEDGHSFVFAGDGTDVELDEDEVAPLARGGTPVRHGPPPPPPAPRTRGPMRGALAGAPVLLQPVDASDRLARLDPASGRVQMVFLRDLPPDAPVTPAGEYAMVEDTMICVYRAGERLFVNIGERRVEITDQIESRIVRGGRRGLRRLLPGAGKPNVFQLLRGRTVVATFSYSADQAALPLMTTALTQHVADETEWDFLVRLHHILSTP